MPETTFTYKIVVGGAGGVGKTTLLHRYLHNVFLPGSTMTIGVAFHSKEIYNPESNRRVKLSLWDLGGQSRFRFLQASYSAGARAAIVFFEMTRPDTLEQVKSWVEMFRAQASPDIPIVLGGTKLDLLDPCLVQETTFHAKEAVNRLCLSSFIPTSSKSGEGVSEIFTYIVDKLVEQSEIAREKEVKVIQV